MDGPRNATPESVEGTVSRVGSYGFTLDGREGWISISKFADPHPELPPEGARIRAGLDRSGYARTIDVIEPAAAGPDDTGDEQPARAASPSGPDRDTRIMRQAVLNTAVALLGSGGREAELADVIDTAEQLEHWVTR